MQLLLQFSRNVSLILVMLPNLGKSICQSIHPCCINSIRLINRLIKMHIPCGQGSFNFQEPYKYFRGRNHSDNWADLGVIHHSLDLVCRVTYGVGLTTFPSNSRTNGSRKHVPSNVGKLITSILIHRNDFVTRAQLCVVVSYTPFSQSSTPNTESTSVRITLQNLKVLSAIRSL